MRKLLVLVIGFLISSVPVLAQSTGTVSGVLKGKDNEPVHGASIVVHNTKTPDVKRQYSTDARGIFTITGMEYGQYNFTFSYLGYKTLDRTVSINRETLNLGTLTMEESTQVIEAVTVEGIAMRTSQKGDTIMYNASAFKVSADSDTENLLAKMPGISVSNGTLQAHGEEVKKVLVDGREFFGDDVSSAIKNLPAEVVDRIEVFNKLSDQAELTGIDDGEGYKAINIVTSTGKRSGQFGKVYGAYGIPDKYIAGGNINIFQGTSRITLLGLFNNLNQQNFSFEDIVGATGNTGAGPGGRGRRGGGFLTRPQDGIATVQALGINYSDKWGKKIEVSGSYFFNHSNTVNNYRTEQWRLMGADTTIYSESSGLSNTNNINHRLNAKIDYKINENHSIMLRPYFSYQSYGYADSAITSQHNIINGVSTAILAQKKISDSKRYGIYTGVSALYSVKLGKPGRTLTTNLNSNYRFNNQLSYPEEYIFRPVYDPLLTPDSINIQKSDNTTYSYRIGGGITYTEPIGKNALLSLEYNAQYNYSNVDRAVYRWLEDQAIFNPVADNELSNLNNSGYLTHRVGPGFRISSKKVNFSGNLAYQYSVLQNTQILPRFSDNSDNPYVFNDVVYSLMSNVNFNKTNVLNVRAHSYTDNPSVSQLSEVIDNSNTNSITTGNPSLKPSYTHRLFSYYTKSNVEKGRTFTLMLGGSASPSYIADDVTINNETGVPVTVNVNGSDVVLEPGAQLTRPVNMGGQWRLYTGVSYGFPVPFIRSNLNFDLRGMFGQTPSMLNNIEYMTAESEYGGGMTLSSNISANLDFTIMYYGSYNRAVSNAGVNAGNNRISSQTNSSLYQNASASLKWVTWKGLTLTCKAGYTQNRGITNDYDVNYFIWDLYAGKKIFKNQRGEISVGVNDILNQNRSFRRTVTGTVITNSYNDAIGRYFSVQFVYNLRNFGKKASQNGKDYDGMDNQQNSSVGVQRQDGHRGPGGPIIRR